MNTGSLKGQTKPHEMLIISLGVTVVHVAIVALIIQFL